MLFRSVGYDVDTILLDTLAQEHHGTSTYVRPGDSLDETLSTFYSKISTPVLTNLSLDFGGLPVYDLYPNPLPDLFLGSQIILTGRYRAGGVTNVTLKGNVNGENRTFSYPEQSFTQDGRSSTTLAALPRLWATRKIGYLLNQVRLQGPEQETVDQIVKLSIRYGIVTPYTSYLVTEPLALGVDAQEKIVQAEMGEFQSMATAPASGEGAVNKAADQGAMAGAQAPAAASAEVQSQVRAIGSRTFLKVDGVWTDTAFDPQTMTTHKVGFLSDDYFALASLDPDVAAALALGDRVIFLFDQSAYEIVTVDTPTSHIQLPTPVSTEGMTPAPSQQSSATPIPGSTAQAGSTTPKPAGSSSLCAGVILPLLGLLILLRKRR